MIYLDYSATTPVNKEVLDTYVKTTNMYIGNPNSLHKLGMDSKKIIDEATKQVKKILKTDKEVIYTSGATESNNLAIFGVCKKYRNRGNHIITTHLEHSSVIESIKALQEEGYQVSYVKLTKNGQIDLENLKELITDKTILISISAVNSEIGIEQNLDEIGKIIKEYPKIVFHSDATQIIGKKEVSFDNVDLVSMSSQKFFGMKGVGVLLKNKNIELQPIIYGGKSTTIYRSGTPATPLIISFSKALRLAYEDIEEKYKYVLKLSNYTKEKLKNINNTFINSTDKSIPHIINISVKGIKSETLMHALEEEDIYISTRTACSKKDDLSEAVLELTHDKEKAEHSLRISISYLTTKEEIDKFLEILKEKIEWLSQLVNN